MVPWNSPRPHRTLALYPCGLTFMLLLPRLAATEPCKAWSFEQSEATAAEGLFGAIGAPTPTLS